jgi:hypothetical protein
MRRLFSALLVTTALGAPAIVPPNAQAGTPRVNASLTVRVYDPYRRDYHNWDGREERAYRAYLGERHRSYVAYQRQREAERRAYWRWRHEREERLEHERRR